MSVVTYDSGVRLEFGLTHMDDDSKEKTKALVKAIRDGSSTNLSGGLLKGIVLQGCTNPGKLFESKGREVLKSNCTYVCLRIGRI